jgi:hypothetical protein
MLLQHDQCQRAQARLKDLDSDVGRTNQRKNEVHHDKSRLKLELQESSTLSNGSNEFQISDAVRSAHIGKSLYKSHHTKLHFDGGSVQIELPNPNLSWTYDQIAETVLLPCTVAR